MIHCLKCTPDFFSASKAGLKPFELRKNDRPFKVGDTYINQEWDEEGKLYTGEEVQFKITYILDDAPKFGLKPGFCILGLVKAESNSH